MSGLKYGQFCPVAQAAEIIGARWTPLILRELMCGAESFGDLRRGIPLITQSQLTARLKELEASGVVHKEGATRGKPSKYQLTEAGAALTPVIEMLGLWGHRWLEREIRNDELDPGYLLWDVRRTIEQSLLPEHESAVIAFEFSGVAAGKRRWWLLSDAQGIDLCIQDPRREVVLKMSGHIRNFIDVWLGHCSLRASFGREEISAEGKASWRRSAHRWFGPSRVAKLARHP